MDPATSIAPEAPPTPPASPKTPDLVAIATQLHAKHGGKAPAAPAGGPRPHPGGPGRQSRDQELKTWLAKSGLKTVPVDSADGAPGVPVDSAPGYTVDPAFVQGCCETLLKGLEAWRQGMVYRKALAIGEDKALAKDLSEDAAAPPGAIQVMTLCSGQLAMKYDFLAAASPEALFITAGIVWLAKDLALWKRLRQLEELKEDKKQPEKPAP